MNTKKEKLKIAIIGCGRFSKSFVKLFKEHPYVEKVWVCDEKKDRAEQYSKDFDVPIIDSFEEALNSKERLKQENMYIVQYLVPLTLKKLKK